MTVAILRDAQLELAHASHQAPLVIARPITPPACRPLALSRPKCLRHLDFQDLLHRLSHQLLQQVLVLLHQLDYRPLGLSGHWSSLLVSSTRSWPWPEGPF